MWLQACAFDIVSPQHTHNQVKKQGKIAMNISDVINLDKKREVFSVGGLKEWYNYGSTWFLWHKWKILIIILFHLQI